jgi:1-acyl-sn-glycerol-3-phosphate acyltransferase
MSGPPPVAGWFQDGFHTFLKPFLKRHFHTIAVDRQSQDAFDAVGQGPVIVYGNHPSWWDPLIAHLLCRLCFHPRQFYAPIDAAALAKYQVFKKLGFYGIDLGSKQGASQFLKTSTAILQAPQTSLWITPEGRFCDHRDHSATLMPGLAHLCTKLPAEGMAIPMALEYTFWEERLPECLVRFGTPITPGDVTTKNKSCWAAAVESALRENQRLLAANVIERNPALFRPILSGKRGAGGIYDTFRRLRSVLGGHRFEAQHGGKFN